MNAAKLRPHKIRNAIRRRVFERIVPLTRYEQAPGGIVDLGSTPGGWSVPSGLIQPDWVCYSVGAGGDVSFDLALIERWGLQIRAFDAVEHYVRHANEQAQGNPR